MSEGLDKQPSPPRRLCIPRKCGQYPNGLVYHGDRPPDWVVPDGSEGSGSSGLCSSPSLDGLGREETRGGMWEMNDICWSSSSALLYSTIPFGLRTPHILRFGGIRPSWHPPQLSNLRRWARSPRQYSPYIDSMYAIYGYIGVVWGVNVGIYGIHGVYGFYKTG